MISWEEALGIVLDRSPLLEVESAPLVEAAGRILAEPIEADRDSPPFDRSAMDGYALRAADVAEAGADLEVIEEIGAGRMPEREVGPGTAARIATGAPIPAGADAIQIQERTERIDGGRRVRILAPVRPGANIRRRGEETRRGEVVLVPGARLGPAEIGLLAWTGRDPAPVRRRPQVSIVSTGDELVDHRRAPAAAQIRNSNAPMLAALVREAGGHPCDLGIAGDHPDRLRADLKKGLAADLMLVTGGVSVGDRDLVRPALEEIGVRVRFHRVAIRPGKPVLFGEGKRTLVFGLPGNPVSCHVLFDALVLPALRKMQGDPAPRPVTVRAALREEVRRHPKRLVFLQARLEPAPDGYEVAPVPTTGSSDLHAVTRGNAMILVPTGAGAIGAGEMVEVLPRLFPIRMESIENK